MRKFLSSLLILAITLPIFGSPYLYTGVAAAGEDFLVSNVSVPSSVKDGDSLKISFSCKNTTSYSMPIYMIAATTNVTRGGIPYGTANTVESSMGPVTINGGVVEYSSIAAGQTKTASMTLRQNNARVGDNVKLTIYCAMMGAGSNTVYKSLTVAAAKTAEEIAAEKAAAEAAARAAEIESYLTTLADKFTASDLQTTDISKFDEEKASKVSDFEVTSKEFGSIKFNEAVNIVTSSMVGKPDKVKSSFVIEKGKISVNTDNFIEFDKPASLTMKNLNLANAEVEINRNGEVAGEKVSNVQYDLESKTLTFDVDGFSTYEVTPTLSIDENDDSVSEEVYTFVGSVVDLDAKVTITYGDEEYTDVVVDENGNFSQELTLIEGENTIKVKAVSDNGVEQEEEIVVNFAPVLVPTEVIIAGGIAAGLVVLSTVALAIRVLVVKRRKKNQRREAVPAPVAN